ncbi:MAG: response regulator [Deltaproteobacteria bacterium]|nr:response regulator [Deltaproteobacteria bacterium]
MKTVLVVEDNKDNLEIITYSLQRAGYQVIAAESGEDGVEQAIVRRPFLIIMDINLPGIDGIEAIKRIRASEADGSIPIVAITSHAMRGDREKIMAAGCNGYFEKPFDPITIVDQIHKIIGVQP